jgi:hypothetical protein
VVSAKASLRSSYDTEMLPQYFRAIYFLARSASPGSSSIQAFSNVYPTGEHYRTDEDANQTEADQKVSSLD